MQPNSRNSSNSVQQNIQSLTNNQQSIQNPPKNVGQLQSKSSMNQNNQEMENEPKDQYKGLNLDAEQQQLLQSALLMPFQFVPPPINADLSTTAYRQNFESFIQNNTSTYQMFRRKYLINSGKQYFPPQSQEAVKNNQQIVAIAPGPYPMKYDISKDQNIRVKVFNLKFTGYTMYTTMNEVIKNLCLLNLNTQRLKQLQGLLNQKLQNYYELSEEIKENYRRMYILYKLECETAMLQKQTNDINSKLKSISQYISNNITEEQMNNQEHERDQSD